MSRQTNRGCQSDAVTNGMKTGRLSMYHSCLGEQRKLSRFLRKPSFCAKRKQRASDTEGPNTKSTMATKAERVKPDEKWQESDAKAQLVKDIEAGLIKYGADPKVVRARNPELYDPWNYDYKFGTRFTSVVDKIKDEKKASKGDYAAFLHDRKLHPVGKTTRTGKLKWHGSEARKI